MRPSTRDLALTAGAALIAGFAIRRGINPHDEGLVLAAADRIVGGELPWRDFWFNYGPGEPYALAGLQELFGRSLMAWRIAHVLTIAIASTLAFRLVRREAPATLALAAWLCVAAGLSFPLIPNPLTPALALALAALLIAPRRPGVAGAVAGLAVAFRLDVGLAAAVATAIAAAQGEPRVRRPSEVKVRARERAGAADAIDRRSQTRGRRRRSISFRTDGREGSRALAAALGIGALTTGVPAIAAGPGAWWDQTVGWALELQSLQRLPLPTGTGDRGGDLNKAFEHLFPTLLLVATAIAIAALGIRAVRDRRPPGGLALAALPLVAAGALYLLARADEFHVGLLQATLPLIVAPLVAAERRRSPRRRVLLVAGLIALALPVAYSLDRKGGQLRHSPPMVALSLDVADGVRTDPREAKALARTVAYVRRRVRPGRPVFIANPRHDLVRAGNPLLSVLIGRPNPTRYFVMQPGVVTTEGAQREMVADLRRTRTRMVIRWRSPVADEREPNGAGRLSGVRVLDRHLRRAYEPARRFGDYQVLVAR